MLETGSRGRLFGFDRVDCWAVVWGDAWLSALPAEAVYRLDALEPLLDLEGGYIAKYRWLPAEDVVLILAVRHQREAGYTEDQ